MKDRHHYHDPDDHSCQRTQAEIDARDDAMEARHEGIQEEIALGHLEETEEAEEEP